MLARARAAIAAHERVLARDERNFVVPRSLGGHRELADRLF